MKKGLVINCSPVRNGATAEIVNIISEELASRYEVRGICIDDYDFAFCRGCRACHKTAACVMNDADVIRSILNEFDEADVIVSVSPSYWADIPGQYKAFIDRCTPWCNTHEPHARIKPGKKGYALALRLVVYVVPFGSDKKLLNGFFYSGKKDIVEDKYSVKGAKLKMKSDNRKLRQKWTLKLTKHRLITFVALYMTGKERIG